MVGNFLLSESITSKEMSKGSTSLLVCFNFLPFFLFKKPTILIRKSPAPEWGR